MPGVAHVLLCALPLRSAFFLLHAALPQILFRRVLRLRRRIQLLRRRNVFRMYGGMGMRYCPADGTRRPVREFFGEPRGAPKIIEELHPTPFCFGVVQMLLRIFERLPCRLLRILERRELGGVRRFLLRGAAAAVQPLGFLRRGFLGR